MTSAPTFTASFVRPETLLNQLTIAPGSVVADFGCGSGFFSLAFAKAVGASGCVIALDILPSALEAVESRAKMAGLYQIVTKRANLERENGSGLAAESVDWVILKDVLFQNRQQDSILRDAARVARPGGHIVLMEWKDDRSALVGPEAHLRLSRERLLELIRSAGLVMDRELTVGDFHHAFLLKKENL
jgi:ubiquinone/menaquinone biosynthesis C-methylase UbiE